MTEQSVDAKDTISHQESVTATGISHRFGRTSALTDVSLAIMPGELTALTGANGSGKSTLMRIFAGHLSPSKGAVTRPRDVMLMAGWRPLWADQTVASLAGHFSRRHAGFDHSVFNDGLAAFGLEARSKFSSVGQRSAGLACLALATRAEFTMLDEPERGMDDRSRSILMQLVSDELAEHPRTLLMATHHIDEAAPWCSKFLVLTRGRITLDAEVDEIAERYHWVTGPEGAFEGFPKHSILKTSTLGRRTRALVDTAALLSQELQHPGLTVNSAQLSAVVSALTHDQEES